MKTTGNTWIHRGALITGNRRPSGEVTSPYTTEVRLCGFTFEHTSRTLSEIRALINATHAGAVMGGDDARENLREWIRTDGLDAQTEGTPSSWSDSGIAVAVHRAAEPTKRKAADQMTRSERSDKAASLALSACHNLTGAMTTCTTRTAIQMLRTAERQLQRALALLEANEAERR